MVENLSTTNSRYQATDPRTSAQIQKKKKILTYYFQTAEIQKQRENPESLQAKWKYITKEGTKRGITANSSLETM